MCNRYKQLDDIEKFALQNGTGVSSDYHIFKNLIFAKRTLNQEQYEKYLKIYEILTENKPKPNLVIYIHASLDTILSRIKKRGRIIEKGIEPSYIKQLASDYEEYMEVFQRKNPEVDVLKIDGDKLDFVKNEEDMNYILNEIKRTLSI